MKKIVNILSELITEGKRFKFDDKTYLEMVSLAEKLWKIRDKKFDRKTLVDGFKFKTSDGVDGYVKIVINPRLPYIGYMETKPKFSRDPMDFVMELQPKEYGSKKNLFLTIYHEMLHATDPSQSTRLSPKYLTTYNEKIDPLYWGHPIEFRAITNEFLEGLVSEFERRLKNYSPEKAKILIRALDNILDYFSKGKPLTKTSLDIFKRINDETVLDNQISKLIADFPTRYPGLEEFMTKRDDKPYYLTYIEMIKDNNKSLWPKFLTMLYNTSKEIKEIIRKKGT